MPLGPQRSFSRKGGASVVNVPIVEVALYRGRNQLLQVLPHNQLYATMRQTLHTLVLYVSAAGCRMASSLFDTMVSETGCAIRRYLGRPTRIQSTQASHKDRKNSQAWIMAVPCGLAPWRQAVLLFGA